MLDLMRGRVHFIPVAPFLRGVKPSEMPPVAYLPLMVALHALWVAQYLYHFIPILVVKKCQGLLERCRPSESNDHGPPEAGCIGSDWMIVSPIRICGRILINRTS